MLTELFNSKLIKLIIFSVFYCFSANFGLASSTVQNILDGDCDTIYMKNGTVKIVQIVEENDQFYIYYQCNSSDSLLFRVNSEDVKSVKHFKKPKQKKVKSQKVKRIRKKKEQNINPSERDAAKLKKLKRWSLILLLAGLSFLIAGLVFLLSYGIAAALLFTALILLLKRKTIIRSYSQDYNELKERKKKIGRILLLTLLGIGTALAVTILIALT